MTTKPNPNTVRDCIAVCMAVQPAIREVRNTLERALNNLSREAHQFVDPSSQEGKDLYLFMAHADALRLSLKSLPMVDCSRELRRLFDAGWLDSDSADVRAAEVAERGATAARYNLTGVLA